MKQKTNPKSAVSVILLIVIIGLAGAMDREDDLAEIEYCKQIVEMNVWPESACE